MELRYLGMELIPQVPNDFIVNVQEVINIKQVKNETYNDLFDGLRKKLEGRPDALKAVESWIELNKNEHKDNPDAFNGVSCEWDECYQVFDLRP